MNELPKIEIGQKIKEVFEQSKMSLSNFARAIGTVRQNVYKIFQRESIDTALLWQISEALSHNFFQYYQPKTGDKSLILPPNQESKNAYNSLEYRKLQEKLAIQSQELAKAKMEIDYLKKIIDLMEERASLLLGRTLPSK
jgi:transcriptional regulator with XRE-family HTH domain